VLELGEAAGETVAVVTKSFRQRHHGIDQPPLAGVEDRGVIRRHAVSFAQRGRGQWDATQRSKLNAAPPGARCMRFRAGGRGRACSRIDDRDVRARLP
jgi:hypothetical protein